VASTAGPETRISIRDAAGDGPPVTTSSMATSKDAMAVPLTTLRPVHCMPARTDDSGMIGSPASAGAAVSSSASSAASAMTERVTIAPG
jgi:hypothetical protein